MVQDIDAGKLADLIESLRGDLERKPALDLEELAAPYVHTMNGKKDMRRFKQAVGVVATYDAETKLYRLKQDVRGQSNF